MTIDLPAARTFIHANARVLEARVAETLFDRGDPEAVVRALAAYRNDDGGFGHGLEPDKRAPGSQPLDVEVALERLVMAGAHAPVLVTGACEYLATVADGDGAVPLAFPTIAAFPHAEHWDQILLDPALNPTASIVGFVHALGIEHPWVSLATEWCLRVLETDGPPDEIHALRCVTRLLEHAPDQERAAALAGSVAAALPGTAMFQERPAAKTYGLTPLEFAPNPTSFGRPWFDEGVIAAHLDHLESQQQADGGWPIAWEPPSEASRCDWRGIVTLQALRVLDAYGRLS
ncbi:MAG: hypothetical protein WKF43_02545 [Acidimicrobiales bacterium]